MAGSTNRDVLSVELLEITFMREHFDSSGGRQYRTPDDSRRHASRFS
jgi:hypothetical protein